MIAFRPRPAISAGILTIALLATSAGTETLAAPISQPTGTAHTDTIRAKITQQYDRDDDISVEKIFYEARGFSPIWLTEDGTAAPAAQALLSWVGKADANGLPTSRYGVPALAASLDSISSHSEVAKLETQLTRLFLTYARDISSGLLEPRTTNRNIKVEPRRPDPAALLSELESTSDIPAFLDSLIPSNPAYNRLMQLYAEMRGIERKGGWGSQIAGGQTMHAGEFDPRAEQLRARLIAMGDLSLTEQIASNEVMNDATPPSTDPLLFDPALEAAVRRFQARHGLNSDGVVGAMTLAALNTSAAERVAQAAVGLERTRWLNYNLGSRHILINTAAFTMTMYENETPQFSTRTVVGKSRRHQTPEFNDHLEFIVVNPFWNVPYSIASKEILPQLQEDPTYLEQNNMELLESDLPASEIDWKQVTRRNFPGRIRQRPGPGNALGAVKFLFPNEYSIYMHDTPSRKLFARDRRAYSHGCVRLEDPTGFAHQLLSLQNADPVGAFDRLQALGEEKWVRVREPIPVYVTYRTAWLDADGTRQFRADVYLRDRDVMAALIAAGVSTSGG